VAGFLLERGALALHLGDAVTAAGASRGALRLAAAVDSALLRAEALNGLARVAAAQAQTSESMRLGRESLHLMESIGIALRTEVATWLNALSEGIAPPQERPSR
jgi:hypothetical protein